MVVGGGSLRYDLKSFADVKRPVNVRWIVFLLS